MVTTNGILNRQVLGTKLKIKHLACAAVVVVLIVAIVLIVYLIPTDSDDKDVAEPPDKLDSAYGPVKYVNIVYRHGARNPDMLSTKDEYNDPKYWPEGLGELTEEGILQHYQLGSWMARRYKHLIPDDQRKIGQAIRVVSTDWNRTLMSAEAELAGMFKINDRSSPLSALRRYPVPIHVLPMPYDDLLLVTKKCNNYDAMVTASRTTKEYQDAIKSLSEVTKAINENLGYVDFAPLMYLSVFATLQIEESKGLKLPSWTKDFYPKMLEQAANFGILTETWDLGLKKLKGGSFVKEVINNFKAKLGGQQVRNISMYSSHDTVLAAIMNAMGIYNNVPPPFAALLLFELRQPPIGEPVVTVWYKNSTGPQFTLTIPKCSEACPLSQMETLLKPVIPDDWEKECNAQMDATTANNEQHPSL